MKLFVYGTLKTGHGNNRLVADGEFLGDAITESPFVLFNCGFPMMVAFTEDAIKFPLLPVMGEVWKINDDQLRRVDALEGHPNWYNRQPISVLLNDGVEHVHTYIMPEWVNRPLCKIVDDKYYLWER